MSDGNRNYIDKAELQNTLYIECMNHKQQLKIWFLACRDAQSEEVLTQNVSFPFVFSITV